MINIALDSLSIDKKVILHNINITFNKGEIVAIIGESGSGKSIFSRAILRLLPQNATMKGKIHNDEKIGVILQNPASCFDAIFSIKDHFTETLKAHNIPQTQDLNLANVGLGLDIIDSYPFELSGGSLQRIMIALCLCVNPTFIIADEMTSDLDCIGTKEITNLILYHAKERKIGLLFITHDIFLATKIADRIVVFDNGTIIENGDKDDILHYPKHEKTKELLSQNRALLDTPWGDFSDFTS